MKKTVPENEKSIRHLYSYSQRYLPLKWLKKAGFENVTAQKGYNFFRVYIFSISLSVLTLLISFFGYLLPDKGTLLQIYSLIAMVAAWYGGFRAGIISTLLMALQAYVFLHDTYYISTYPLNPFLQVFLFTVRGVIVSILIDKARQTKVVRTLHKREEQYARTLVEITDKYDQAKEEIKRRDEFLSIASHELKTPLTTMLMKLHDMLNSVKNVSLANFSIPQLMQVLENAEHQIHRLNTMINDLLNVSFITTGRMSLDKENSDLVEITKRVIESFSQSLTTNGYKLSFTFKNSVIGYWDKSRIEQAIINLISNAVKYGNGQPIDIEVAKKGSTGIFSIRDRGEGIDKKEIKNLFGLFTRVRSSNGGSPTTSGLGVGLFVTHQIVKAHGGRIKIATSGLRGTRFTIELPLNSK